VKVPFFFKINCAAVISLLVHHDLLGCVAVAMFNLVVLRSDLLLNEMAA